MKPYLVMKYLLQETCEGKVKSGAEICEYLFEECGIEAEHRSVYTDIEAINNALYIAEHNADIFEAEEAMKNAPLLLVSRISRVQSLSLSPALLLAAS